MCKTTQGLNCQHRSHLVASPVPAAQISTDICQVSSIPPLSTNLAIRTNARQDWGYPLLVASEQNGGSNTGTGNPNQVNQVLPLRFKISLYEHKKIASFPSPSPAYRHLQYGKVLFVQPKVAWAWEQGYKLLFSYFRPELTCGLIQQI